METSVLWTNFMWITAIQVWTGNLSAGEEGSKKKRRWASRYNSVIWNTHIACPRVWFKSFAANASGRQQMMAQLFRCLCQHGRPPWSPWLLALVWPASGCYTHLRCEPSRLHVCVVMCVYVCPCTPSNSVFFTVFLFFCHFTFQVNKQIVFKRWGLKWSSRRWCPFELALQNISKNPNVSANFCCTFLLWLILIWCHRGTNSACKCVRCTSRRRIPA